MSSHSSASFPFQFFKAHSNVLTIQLSIRLHLQSVFCSYIVLTFSTSAVILVPRR